MKEIKSFSVMSAGKVMGLLYALLGVIAGLVMVVIYSFIGVIMAISGEPEGLVMVFIGVGALLMAPVMYGVMGFIAGIIMAWIYNIVAARFGGLKLEIK